MMMTSIQQYYQPIKLLSIALIVLFFPFTVDAKSTEVWVGSSHRTDFTNTIELEENEDDYIDISVGDMNGDGVDDLLRLTDWTYKEVGLFLFSPFNLNPKNDLTASSTALLTEGKNISAYDLDDPSSYFPVGDINADGFNDLIIERGLVQDDSMIASSFVIYGTDRPPKTITLNANTLMHISTSDEVDFFDHVPGCPCDFNADGINDLIITTEIYETEKYTAYIFFGSTTIDETADSITPDISITNLPSTSIEANTDIDGDGISDILLSDYRDVEGTFHAYGSSLVTGVNDWNNIVASNSISIPFVPFQFWYGPLLADLNNDGFKDQYIQFYSRENKPQPGYLFFGGTNNEPRTLIDADVVISSNNTAYGEIDAIESIDINADGINDVILASSTARINEFTSAGAVFIFYGKATSEWGAEFILDQADLIIRGHYKDSLLGSNIIPLSIGTPTQQGILIKASHNSYGFFPIDQDNDGYSALEGDCRLNNAEVYPTQLEETTADAIDNDCDGLVDEGYTFTAEKNGTVMNVEPLQNHVRVTYQDGLQRLLLLTPGEAISFFTTTASADRKSIVTVHQIKQRSKRKRIGIYDAYTGQQTGVANFKSYNNNISLYPIKRQNTSVDALLVAAGNYKRGWVRLWLFVPHATSNTLKKESRIDVIVPYNVYIELKTIQEVDGRYQVVNVDDDVIAEVKIESDTISVYTE